MNLHEYKRSSGFTLVELLIVIIIIGVLAGVMMLAAQFAMDKAEATKIVNNMRIIKTASIMCHADTGNWKPAASAGPSGVGYEERRIYNLLHLYTDYSLSIEELNRCSIWGPSGGAVGPYIRYNASSLRLGVKKALASMASNGVPIYSFYITTSSSGVHPAYNGGNTIHMLIARTD